MPRVGRLAKEGSWIVIGQMATLAGSLVLVRLLTEYLSPIEYGQLALGLTVAGLVNQVVMGGAGNGIGRFYSIAAETNDLRGYLRASRRLLAYATAVVVILALVLMAGLLWLGYSHWMGLAAAALVFSVLSGYNSSLNGIQNAARQRAIVALHGGLDAWLKILLAVGVILWLGSSSTAVVIAYAGSSLLVTGSQLFFLRRLIPYQSTPDRDTTQWMRQMWAYSWPMAAGGLFNWGYYASQRWSLELFASTEEVGQFYALTQIAYTPISMAGAMFLSFLLPILFARAGDATSTERLRSTHRVVALVAMIGLLMTITLAVVSYFAHELVFFLLAAPEYHDISPYMPFVILAAGILQVSHALGSSMLISNKTRSVLPLAIWGQLYISAQNFIFVRIMGMFGLVISMMLGSVIHFAWMYAITMKRRCNGAI